MCPLLGTSEYPVRILDPLCVLRAWKLFSLSLTCQHVPHVSKQLLESEMVGPKQRGKGGELFIFMPVIQEMHMTPFVGCVKMSLQVFIIPNYKAASQCL